MKRWLYIGLFGSVGVNLFLAGIIVANLFWHEGRRHHRGPLNLRGAYHALTDDSKKKAREVWKANREEFRKRIRELRAARREARRLVREDGADIARIDAAIERIATLRDGLRRYIHTILRKIAAAIPEAERLKYYKAALKRRRGRRRR